MKWRYINNSASNRALNPEFKKYFGFLTSLLSSRNTLWPRSESDFFFSGLAALKLEGEPIISPGDEPGARLLPSRAESSPCSAQAVKLVWAHPPLSQPAKEFVPGKRGPALSLRHHQRDSCEQRRREEQETGKGQPEEPWRRENALSRELGTCLDILRATGVSLECANSWVCTSMASVLLERLEKNGRS